MSSIDFPARIDLGDLYATSTDVLVQFRVRNVAPDGRAVRVAPVANAATALRAVRFQLQNENVRQRADDSAPFVVQSTRCNQLFNAVGVLPLGVDACTLQPDESVAFVCVFQLPPPVARSRVQSSSSASSAFALRALSDAVTLRVDGDELVTIALQGRCCETRVVVDALEFVSFDDCVVGSVYVRDVTLRNVAEIELVYSVSISGDDSDAITCEDYETGAIRTRGSLAAYASETLRIVFRPRTVGALAAQLIVLNENDEQQTQRVALVANVSKSRQLALVCEPSSLDFGACYTLCAARASLKLTNSSGKALLVKLSGGAHDDELSFSWTSQSALAVPPTPLLDGDGDGDGAPARASISTKDSGGDAQVAATSSGSDLSLMAGASVTVQVAYCPKPGDVTQAALVEAAHAEVEMDAAVDDDGKRAALEARIESSAFMPGALLATKTRMLQLTARFSAEDGSLSALRRITCRAAVTTSFFVCSPAHINMGDCAVGQHYAGRFAVQNASSVATRVLIDVQSKCLHFKQYHVDLAPHERAAVPFDFVPRKVNAHYRKQLTLRNSNNPANEWHVLIVSNNVDVAGITTHSYFYELNTPLSRNFLSFDNLVVGNSTVRTFSINNVCRSSITLRITPSRADEVAVYRLEPMGRSAVSTAIWTADSLARRASNGPVAADSMRRSTIARPSSFSFVGFDFEARTAAASDAGTALDGGGGGGGGGSGGGASPLMSASHSAVSLTSLELAAVVDDLASPRNSSGSIARSSTRSLVTSGLHSAAIDRHYLDLARSGDSRSRTTARNSSVDSSFAADDGRLVSPPPLLDSGSAGDLHVLLRSRRTRRSSNNIDESDAAARTAAGSASTSTVPSPPRASRGAQSPQLQRRTVAFADDNDVVDVDSVQRALMQLLADCEHDNAPLPALSSTAKEYSLAQATMHHAERLRSAIADGLLAPVEDLHLVAGHEELLVVVWTPRDEADLDGTLRKKQASLEFSLRSFDRSVLPLGAKLPSEPRTLQLTGKVCRLFLELAQRHINFGPTPLHNATRVKTLVVGNGSSVPLIYAIADPGTIASRSIHIARDQRLGVVLPYRAKEIRFTFRPTFTGTYSEQLRVINVRDRSNDGVIHIKADVLKPRQFTVSTQQMPFGTFQLGAAAPAPKRFVITNSARARTYLVQLVTTPLDAASDDGETVSIAVPSCVALSLELTAEPAVSAAAQRDAAARELELDDVKRKIRIAESKGDAEKIEKLGKRVAEIEAAISSDAASGDASAAADQTVRGVNSIAVNMPANTTLGVTVLLASALIGRSDLARRRLPLPCTAAIRVSDAKNVHASKLIQLSAFFERIAAAPRVARIDAPASVSSSRRNSFSDSHAVDVRAASFAAMAALALRNSVQIQQQAQANPLHQQAAATAASPAATTSPHDGRQSPAIVVSDLLRFPAFSDDADSVGIDLGTCFIDALTEQARESVVPFDVVNVDVERRVLSVDVSSNLVRQVFAYADEALKTPARDVRIAPGAAVRLFVVVRPTVSRDLLRGNAVRNLVGGLLVDVKEASASLSQSTPPSLRSYALRFRALLGLTVLRVSPSAVRHVAANAGDVVTGSFRIAHDTPNLQTEFSVSGFERVKLARTHGVLTGAGTDGATCEIQYSVGPLGSGWLSERLCILDARSSRRCFVTISVLVDDGSLRISLSDQLDQVPLLHIPTLLVCPVDAEMAALALDARYAKLMHSFELTNASARAVALTPLTNLNLVVVWQQRRALDADETAIQQRDAEIAEKVVHECGHRHTLRAGESVTVFVSSPLPSQLRPQKMSRLRRAQAAMYRGQVQFLQTPLADDGSPAGASYVSHAVLVRGSFHASFAELQPRACSVGLIGHENQYQPATVQLRIRNACGVDFRGMFEAPHCVTFVAQHVLALNVAPEPADDDTAAGGTLARTSSTALSSAAALATTTTTTAAAVLDEDVDIHGRDVWLRANREVVVQAVVHADRLLLQPGPFLFDVVLYNSRNVTNTHRCEMGGTLTAAPLRLAGLDDSVGHARSSLTLHSFGVPLSPATAPEYVWFTAHNVTPHAMRLTLVPTMHAPLHLTLGLDIVSEATNAAVTSVTLLPDSSVVIGVRVRAGRIPHRAPLPPDTVVGTLMLQLAIAKKAAAKTSDDGEPSDEAPLLSDAAISLRPTLIDVRAQARLLPTFDLSASSVALRLRGATPLTVSASARTATPVQYRVSLRGPLASLLRVEPMFGHVPRGGAATLRCSLAPASADAATTLAALGGANQAALARETAIVVRDANYTWSVCEASISLDLTAESPTATSAAASESASPVVAMSRNDSSANLASAALVEAPSIAAAAATALASQASAGSSTIEVQGCVEAAGRLTIHMGQLMVGSSRTWSLRLVTASEEPVPFRITTPAHHKWLAVEPTKGVVSAQASVSVQLICTGDSPAVHGTFILIENGRNACNHRLIRANLIVLATDIERLFSIVVGGGSSSMRARVASSRELLLRATPPTSAGASPAAAAAAGAAAPGAAVAVEPLSAPASLASSSASSMLATEVDADKIDFGDVYYNTSIQRVRFFEIWNNSDNTLSFKLTSNLLSGWTAAHRNTEIRFSLSAVALDFVRYASVSARSSLRIYVVLFAAYDAELQPAASSVDPLDVVAEAIVTCRMVKDHRRTLRIHARCRQPTMRVSNNALLFDISSDIRNALPLSEVTSRHARVLNVLSSSARLDEAAAVAAAAAVPVHYGGESGGGGGGGSASLVEAADGVRYVVRNRTLFFECYGSSVDEQSNVHGALPGVVRVWPRADAIEAHRESLLNQREVAEELVVYNAAEPSEKHVLTLTLRLAAPTALRGRYPITRDNYAFLALEMCISRFLDSVARFWQQHVGAGAGAADDAGVRRALERVSDTAAAPLYVELCWLTDELIKFGSSKHVAYADVLTLAHVVFRFLFEREPLALFAGQSAAQQPPLVRKWIGQLQYYLSYETYLSEDADVLSFAGLRPLLDKFHQ